MHPFVAKERSESDCRFSVEVDEILVEWHRQHRINLQTSLQRQLGDQQVGPLGHARHDANLGLRQATFQILEKVTDLLRQSRYAARIKIAVARYANNQR
jgi:hypothetical protein